MREPHTPSPVADMEDVLQDLQGDTELEQRKIVGFWRDMTVTTEDELPKLCELESSGEGPGERREGVSSDVQLVFEGQTYSQLQVTF